MLPLTRVANKHLLPVYDRPMIFHAIESVAKAGIDEAMVIVDAEDEATYRDLLGDPAEHGLKRLEIGVQQGPRGIADAIAVAEPFADGVPILALLGDNLFGDALAGAAKEFLASGSLAMVLLTTVPNPRAFGVAKFGGSDARLVEIIEKPKVPPTDLAVTGAYFYRPGVFGVIASLETPADGVIEITDVNNAILNRGELDWSDVEGWWGDAGTPEGLRLAANCVAEKGVNGGPPRKTLQTVDL
jgi:glucose-1-phosphate thymidylyltransferase